MQLSDLIEIPEGSINIAAIFPCSRVLGPGQRYIIWLQGCLKDCLNCGSPEWKTIKISELRSVESILQEIHNNKNIQGITISGGEPFLQARELFSLTESIKKSTDLSIICYSGYTIEELLQLKNEYIHGILSLIDVLIDGPYIDVMNDNKGLRGSNNQRVHFITDRYKQYRNDFLFKRREIEIHLKDKEYLLVGIKPKGFMLKI